MKRLVFVLLSLSLVFSNSLTAMASTPEDTFSNDQLRQSADALFNLPSPEESEEICTACKAGCLQQGYIESFRHEVPEQGDCPEGYWPISEIRELREHASCQEAKWEAWREEKKERARRDLLKTRIMLQPTAIGLKPYNAELTGYFGGLWNVQAGVLDNLQVGGSVVVPALMFGVIPSAMAHGKIADYVHLSLGVYGGILGLFTLKDHAFWTVGANTALTIHYGDHILNFSMMGFFVSELGRKESFDTYKKDSYIMLFPGMGYRYAFSQSWMVVFEFESILRVYPEKDSHRPLQVPLVLIYGFRGQGEVMFGDVGMFKLLIANNQEFNNESSVYFPIGIPYFSLGFRF